MISLKKKTDIVELKILIKDKKIKQNSVFNPTNTGKKKKRRTIIQLSHKLNKITVEISKSSLQSQKKGQHQTHVHEY